MKTILLTLLLAGSVFAQNLSLQPVSNVCGAPSDVNVKVNHNSSGILRVDLILLDDNGSPVELVESLRLNPFGHATFLQVAPCQSYRVQPRVVKGAQMTFSPPAITIHVQDGNPFNLEFTGTSN